MSDEGVYRAAPGFAGSAKYFLGTEYLNIEGLIDARSGGYI